jgi:hypothetical protein
VVSGSVVVPLEAAVQVLICTPHLDAAARRKDRKCVG